MKKIGLLLLAAVAATGFVSCNTTKVDQPSNMSFVTVHTSWLGDYYFETDTEKRVYPGDKSRVQGYEPKEGQRALITFNVLDTPMPGYDYNVAVYGIGNIPSSVARVVTDEAELETLKDDAAEFRGGRLLGHWATMIVRYEASDLSKHKFSLIVNQAEPSQTNEGYLDVELRHDNGGDTPGMLYDTYVSFDMQEIEELLAGQKGITLRFNNGAAPDYAKLDRLTEETQQTL
ncbi:MAG: NigD-like protein [Alistipes sp.]|nr:NigD-like protein [Alistipes sp.]